MSPSPVGGQGVALPADPLRWSRPDAIAAFGRHPTPDEIEALDERAAIFQFDAGLAREAAERHSLRNISSRSPLVISENPRGGNA